MKTLCLFFLGFLIAFHATLQAFELKNGDRIALIGDTILEREQQFGYLETKLTLAAGSAKITVRNLAWSGDTVFGDARSYFGPPKEGIDRLSGHLDLIKPSVVFFCYGSQLAFEQESEDAKFFEGYQNLIQLVRQKDASTRIVILSPPPLENLPAPLPNLNHANARLKALSAKFAQFANKEKATFVDTFTLMGGGSKEIAKSPLTNNGIHFGPNGYMIWTSKVLEGLKLSLPHFDPAETTALRKEIVEKDRLFFNRWRPANETYLYGFRKHEQGNNAVEIEQFDPLVDQADQKIHEIKLSILSKKKTDV